MASNPGSSIRRPPLVRQRTSSSDVYSDSRTHGYQGPSRHVCYPRVSNGGGAIAKSEDGDRCVVAGRESLRILRMSEPASGSTPPSDLKDHKFAVGRGGHRIEVSRNFWEGSGLKMDSSTTDVAWGHGPYSNKILTSARNGELIMWDLNKSGASKYERRARDHARSIHALAYSSAVQYYCMTGSADGDLRVWDIRDLSKSAMKIRHPAGVRAVVLSPVPWQPLRVITALDNGSIYRWDVSMGQRGVLDRIPAAHAGAILGLDWTASSSSNSSRQGNQGSWYGSTSSTMLDDILPGPSGIGAASESDSSGEGWLASGGVDRCVKIWDLTALSSKSQNSQRPTYTLRTPYPVRRVSWRPGYECELAIVSNGDLGTSTNTELSQAALAVSPTSSSLPEKLNGALASPRPGPLALVGADSAPVSEVRAKSVARGDGSDPVEIWDVRRGFIAKWSLSKSAVEGGVTDIIFADSHALWTLHMSGTFSQLDVRESTRPLASIPRTAASFDARGTLAFIADRPRRREIPYDDVSPETRMHLEDWQGGMKGLGDPVFAPISQNLGTFTTDVAGSELEMFVKLARVYVYQGKEKRDICGHNAQVAAEAGNHGAAEIWMLLESLLVDLMDTPPSAPTSDRPHTIILPHSTSAPAAIPTIASIYPPVPSRSFSTDVDGLRRDKDHSPGSRSRHSDDRRGLSGHSPHRLTPASSPASSPHRGSITLPPLPAALLARRESSAGLPLPFAHPRRPSSLRRPSFSTRSIQSGNSESPSERSHASSLRHVGEGALDDSDSSGSEGALSDGEGESEPRVPVSPYLYPRGAPQPSPLSRVAGQQTWTEDEHDEEDDSPSPASTDSEDSDAEETTRAGKPISRRSSGHGKTRSRSSTVASLVVASSQRTERTVTRRDSQSSIRTVIASPVQIISPEAVTRKDDTIRDLNTRHKRPKSEAFSGDFILDIPDALDGKPPSMPLSEMDREYVNAIRQSERRFRAVGWLAVQDAFAAFVEQGDIQTSVFLALVVPEELKVSKAKTVRILESYLELLGRLRLYDCAAYLRKYVDVDSIRAPTTTSTIIYTTCGRCRKPVNVPLSEGKHADKPYGSYSFCSSCKSNVGTCAICRLPVRSLLFQCPVCMHGGHQECYRKYYMSRPMVELQPPRYPSPPQPSAADRDTRTLNTPDPSSIAPPKIRGRAISRSRSVAGADSDGGSDDSHGTRLSSIAADMVQTLQLHLEGLQERPTGAVLSAMPNSTMGHPCAAGCGHMCWVSVYPERLAVEAHMQAEAVF